MAAAARNASATNSATASNTATAAQNAAAAHNASLANNASATTQNVANQVADNLHQVTTTATASNLMSAAQRAAQTIQSAANNAATANNASDIQSASNQNSALTNQNASQATQAQNSTMVFANLAALNSNHLLLQVNMTAQQANNLMRLYQGSTFSKVSSLGSFPFATPACATTAPIVTPVTGVVTTGAAAVSPVIHASNPFDLGNSSPATTEETVDETVGAVERPRIVLVSR
jgi:hypothetical protein